MTEKNLELLRPFDAEKAKAGEPICRENGDSREFVAGPDTGGFICVRLPDGRFSFAEPSNFRMAPLAWVEGRPVYRSDVLYAKLSGKAITIVGIYAQSFTALDSRQNGYLDNLTWTPPAPKAVKHQRWFNLYPDGISQPFASDTIADQCAGNDRIDCRLIEWEVPAK